MCPLRVFFITVCGRISITHKIKPQKKNLQLMPLDVRRSPTMKYNVVAINFTAPKTIFIGPHIARRWLKFLRLVPFIFVSQGSRRMITVRSKESMDSYFIILTLGCKSEVKRERGGEVVWNRYVSHRI